MKCVLINISILFLVLFRVPIYFYFLSIFRVTNEVLRIQVGDLPYIYSLYHLSQASRAVIDIIFFYIIKHFLVML